MGKCRAVPALGTVLILTLLPSVQAVTVTVDGAVLHQVFAEHRSRYPRPETLERQERRLRATRERLAADEAGDEPATARVESPAGQPEPPGAGAGEPQAEEPLPETAEELRAALREARREVEKWKRAYEQYHRITHGN